GSFTYAPDRLEGAISTATVVARRILNGADVSGSLEASVRDPSDPKDKLNAHVRWEGLAAGIEHTVNASLADDRVDAVVDVPETEPANIRALWPASPIGRPTRAHVEARGPLADVDVDVRAAIGDATLGVRGKVSAGDEKSAKLAVDARNVDVHQLAAAAPSSRLGLTGDVSAAMSPAGAVSGDVDLRFLGGRVGTNAVPSATIRGEGALSASRQLTAHAALVVDEPGAPTHLDVRAFPKGASSAVDFDLAAKSIDLNRVPELRHAVRGSFGVHATGELDVGAMTVEAKVEGKADGLVQGANRVHSATIEGTAVGAVAAPRIDVSVDARDIVASGYRFVSASVNATGKATAPHVTALVRGPDTPDVDASADLDVASGLSIGPLEVALARKGERAVVTARRVALGGGDVRVDGARIDGMGEPMTATMAMAPESLRVVAATKGIDLARVARLANLEKTLKGGTLSFDTDLRLQRRGAQGRVTLDLTEIAAGNAKDITGHVQASLTGQNLAAKVHVEAGDIGSVDLDAPKVELAGGDVLAASTWKRAWGALDVDASGDLAKALAMIPREDAPFSRAHGKVHLKGHIAREDARDLTPDVTLSVTTEQLELAAKTPESRD
ncbi:MAG TPA: hypothetical protein VHS09_09115, partial [Polyangiaceae bacterium]|nr:hypothetical protein [Polyangiaceae bacterium]